MKNKLITAMALLAIVILSLMATACNDEEEPTVRSSGTVKPLSFGDDCKVTIKSDDKFTDTEWANYCNQVVATIESEYTRGDNSVNKIRFDDAFADAESAVVKILPNSASLKCEVKVGDKTIYLRMNAIGTVDLQAAVAAVRGSNSGVNQQAKAKVLGNCNAKSA
jgi:hypothetical protein